MKNIIFSPSLLFPVLAQFMCVFSLISSFKQMLVVHLTLELQCSFFQPKKQRRFFRALSGTNCELGKLGDRCLLWVPDKLYPGETVPHHFCTCGQIVPCRFAHADKQYPMDFHMRTNSTPCFCTGGQTVPRQLISP